MNPYEFAFRGVGCNIKYVGTKETCTLEELETEISDKTSFIAFSSHHERRGVSLSDTVKIAKEHDIPIIVDTAGNVLPRSNLKKFAKTGADLIAVRGGKQIKGPNDTGILYGREDLIEMAKLQSSPFNGIGRGMKVDRTQMVGLLVALKLFLDVAPEEEEVEFQDWQYRANWVGKELKDLESVSAAKVLVHEPWDVRAMISFCEKVSAFEIAFNLRKQDPSIWVETSMTGKKNNRIGIAFDCLNTGEERNIVEALKTMLNLSKVF